MLIDYHSCQLCPNMCSVDRTAGVTGRCGETNEVRIAWSGLHKGEEPPVTGKNGSGMIFFCGCPLHCQYCQNIQISQKNWPGTVLTEEELGVLMLKLQEFGANNINLVTGTHFIPSIVKAIIYAKEKGLEIPIVWNSSGFERVEALREIDPFIDLYLIDVKTLDSSVASQFCGLACYSENILSVMKFLRRRHSRTYMKNGSLYGVLVRHLLFPGTLEATLNFLSWFSDNLKDSCYLSLMVQFVPPAENPGFLPITNEEYDKLTQALEKLEIDNGFVQELGDDIKWIPDFSKDQPFPEKFASPLPWFLKLKKSRQK